MGISKMMTGVAAVAVMGVAGVAQAASVNYQVGGITVDAYNPANSNNGLEIHHNVLSPSGFTLDDGQSHTFDAFQIWTPESSISGDDLAFKSISVGIAFSAPGGLANVEGDTYGTGNPIEVFGHVLGYINEEGHVRWDGPATVNLGSVVYQVTLSDEDFQHGFLDLASAYCNYATVQATVTQVSSVPTPAAAGIGLTMLGGLVMKRRKA